MLETKFTLLNLHSNQNSTLHFTTGNVFLTKPLKLIPCPHPHEAKSSQKLLELNPILHSQVGGGIRYQEKA
jgi:hypothetical protein